MLLGVTGRARVGKDTFGRHLVENYSFEHAYFAKPLKNMLTALGFPESQYQTTEEKEAVIPDIGRSYRYLAQTIGTEWGRNLVHPDIWLLMMARKWDPPRPVQRRVREHGDHRCSLRERSGVGAQDGRHRRSHHERA
jgi:hypothetical protein